MERRSGSDARVIVRTETRTKYVNTVGYGLGAVVLAGLIGLTHHAIGLSGSIGIPFTDAHLSLGTQMGDPASLSHAVPNYAQSHINNPQDGLSYFQPFHVGPSGIQFFDVIGKQAGAPAIDLNLSWATPTDTLTIF